MQLLLSPSMTKHSIGVLFCLLFFVLGCIVLEQNGRERFEKGTELRVKLIAKADLSSFIDYGFPELEFSVDGKYLCVWWQSDPRSTAEKGPGKFAVLDLGGNEITDAVDEKRAMKEPFIALFPKHSWRTLGIQEFIKGATSWVIAEDCRKGLRSLSPVYGVRSDSREPWKCELWKLRPTEERAWEVSLPYSYYVSDVTYGTFLQDNRGEFILLAFFGGKAYILGVEDGRVVDSFTYGHIETSKEEDIRRKQLNLPHISSGEFKFTGHVFAVDKSRRLLACGEFIGRRVRLVSLDKPHNVVWELNTDDSIVRSKWRGSGEWTVRRVAFGGGGVLVVDYFAPGPRELPHASETVVYDVDRRKEIWRMVTTQPDGNGAVVSPDGKTMGVLRGEKGRSLEILTISCE